MNSTGSSKHPVSTTQTILSNVLLVAILLFSLSFSNNAHAERDWRITTGIEFVRVQERMSIVFPRQSAFEDRSLYSTRITLGLRSPILPVSKTIMLVSQTQLASGLVFETADPNWGLYQQFIFERQFTRRWFISSGLGVGWVANSGHLGRSRTEITLPVSVRYWFGELIWQPTLTLAAAQERQRVFTGEKLISAKPGIEPVVFAVRLLF